MEGRSGIYGDVSGIYGDVNTCEITEEDREKGIAINDLVTKEVIASEV